MRRRDFIFDGNELSRFLSVEDVRRPIMPPVTARTLETNGYEGASLSSVSQGMKSVVVSTRLIRPFEKSIGLNKGFEQARRLLAGYLYRDHLCKLVLPDAPDLYEMAVVDGTLDIEKFVYTRTIDIEFLCERVSYGRTVTKQADKSLSFSVSGTWPAYSVITVNYSDPFTITVDGKAFTTKEKLSNDPTVIDSKERTVTQNGQPVKYDIFSDIPVFEPGMHTISCDHPFIIEWTERWL